MSVENSLSEQFRTAVGSPAPLRIAVSNASGSEPVIRTLERPFAVIGQAKGCDIRLRGKGVSYRHAYLQVIGGRPFCVDFGSKTGVSWDDGSKGSSWLSPGRTARIGNFEIKLADDSPAPVEHDLYVPGNFNPLDQFAGVMELPPVEVEFLAGGKEQTPQRPVARMITLIGRAPASKFQLKSPDVSKVHCSLILTPTGLWAIDLLGRDGTRVNGRRIRFARLDDGRRLSVGRFQMQIHSSLIEADPTAAAIEEADETIVEGTHDITVFDTDDPPEESSEDSGPLLSFSRVAHNKVFKVEQHHEAIVVMPMEGTGFRYQDVHRESNQILQLLATTDRPRLVVDLKLLNYSGSELIGALIRLARYATDHGGGTVFCNASEKMQKVLQNMSLAKLWPYHATREEAINALLASESPK